MLIGSADTSKMLAPKGGELMDSGKNEIRSSYEKSKNW